MELRLAQQIYSQYMFVIKFPAKFVKIPKTYLLDKSQSVFPFFLVLSCTYIQTVQSTADSLLNGTATVVAVPVKKNDYLCAVTPHGPTVASPAIDARFSVYRFYITDLLSYLVLSIIT